MENTIDTEATVVDPNEPIPMRGLSKDLYSRLIKFLDEQPHIKVRELIDSLTSSPVINVTVSQPKKA